MVDMKTKITQLPGLTKTDVAKLTPAAKELTKYDLIELAYNPEKEQKLLSLTVKDLKSIESAFESYDVQRGMKAEAGASCCCTCTPACCCTASAVVEPVTVA